MQINGRNNSITNEFVPLLSTPMSRGIMVSHQKVVMQSLGMVMCGCVWSYVVVCLLSMAEF